MGLVTWTAVCRLPSVRDTAQDVRQSLNGLIGAQLQRLLQAALRTRGWDFPDAWPEDHGWHSDTVAPDEAKKVIVDLVTVPELDEATAEGGALEDRWRIVIGTDTGWLPQTKARRMAVLQRLADAVEESCRELGAQAFTWEVGGR